MNLAEVSGFARRGLRAVLVAAVVVLCSVPAMAQNKKNSWEVFLYFGGFFANDIPSAIQKGQITETRVEPYRAYDSFDSTTYYVPNLGKVGGDGTGDPNYPFTTGFGGQFFSAPCNGSKAPLDPNGDPRAPYFDECDGDQETEWLYNATGIKTNGAVQTDDSEFQLGLRGGYNITRHLEVEVDIGFGKQRVDLTKNLDPLLTASINDISDPRARALAEFYQFTWANADYRSIVLLSTDQEFPGEHPNVISSRHAADPNYNIPLYFPERRDDPGSLVPAGEVFDDVTGFVNRVYENPTAFRNRGNQININTFTVSASANWNFNTKADSRIIPYLGAGIGRWMRRFDSPWEGNDTTFLSAEAGLRFFVNEIFAFRADARWVNYQDDSFTIKARLDNFNLKDRRNPSISDTCYRDQFEIRPPCTVPPPDPSWDFPNFQGGGGNAGIEIEAELDDFYEIRVGFDVILGGK
ncbi:MAG TPA: hypothetical protein VGK94_08080 [Candidatus Polarisedimenticolia bacterium]